MDVIRIRVKPWPRPGLALGALLALGCVAAGAAAGEHVDPAPQAVQAPWLQPIQVEQPIRRMSVLKAEYRRIRTLRRMQLQPEYERRVSLDGEDAADAWRQTTLREVARRDLRDLRDRLER